MNVKRRKIPAPRTPRRERGEKRVAALLEAAAATFAEQGYAAATMTGIAARAGAPIGSLYQFFPTKETLGAALMRRYLDRCVAALGRVEARAAGLAPVALARALLRVFADLTHDRALAIALLDALPRERESGTGEFRAKMLACLAGILKARWPALTAARAQTLAAAVLWRLKAAVAFLARAPDEKSRRAALRDLCAMLAAYLPPAK